MAGVDLGRPIGLRDRAMLAVLCATGMRCGEMAQLEIGDLDLERSVVLVREGKGGKERLIPLGDRALHRGEAIPRPGPAAARAERARCDAVPGSRGPPLEPAVALHVDRQAGGCRVTGQARRLPRVAPHHGHADAGERGRSAPHSGDARARRAFHHADQYAGGDSPAAAGAREDAPGGQQARAGQASNAGECRGPARGDRRCRVVALPYLRRALAGGSPRTAWLDRRSEPPIQDGGSVSFTPSNILGNVILRRWHSVASVSSEGLMCPRSRLDCT